MTVWLMSMAGFIMLLGQLQWQHLQNWVVYLISTLVILLTFGAFMGATRTVTDIWCGTPGFVPMEMNVLLTLLV